MELLARAKVGKLFYVVKLLSDVVQLLFYGIEQK